MPNTSPIIRSMVVLASRVFLAFPSSATEVFTMATRSLTVIAWFDRSTGVLPFTHTRFPDAFNAIIGSHVPFTSKAGFDVFRGRSFDDDSENPEQGKAALMVTSSIGHGDAPVDVGVPCTAEQDDRIE